MRFLLRTCEEDSTSVTNSLQTDLVTDVNLGLHLTINHYIAQPLLYAYSIMQLLHTSNDPQ